MASVVVYTSPWCPYCNRVKALLQHKQVAFEEVDVSTDPALRFQMEERSGGHTVPQVFINDMAIGGCDDLHALEQAGELDRLLAPVGPPPE